ncbi:cytochrome b/b6 domain-containing protein [Pseudidiomarina taiwanensis]|uniref:Cytochrome b561 bacterial/Ni-hydrogenase domain-containing protein n=1 Tax=Pseudidiomarina taiwanensis TaxID=337250 RepID=A0A432ZME7_9GAMM|nr:cytochrome b/b6 domain-containing protein [Pseudidiomarina taiwanensis]RUO79048.1 hypothetical protein CWI83_00565 [Pseudidiomarina taiwanensis]
MSGAQQKVKVWDGFVRIFHWLLVLLFAGLWWTAENHEMERHGQLGYILVGLLVARILWGLWGSETARFSQFVRSPKAVIGYLKDTEAKPSVGHNPLGGWSVIVLLLLLLAQVVTGLFNSDDILFSGPLAHLVKGDLAEAIGEIHEIVFEVLLVLIAVHIIAIVVYRLRGKNLLIAMLTGWQRADAKITAPRIRSGLWGMVLAAVCIAASWWYFA